MHWRGRAKELDEGMDAANRALSTVMYDDEYAIIREYAIGALEEIDPQASNYSEYKK